MRPSWITANPGFCDGNDQNEGLRMAWGRNLWYYDSVPTVASGISVATIAILPTPPGPHQLGAEVDGML